MFEWLKAKNPNTSRRTTMEDIKPIHHSVWTESDTTKPKYRITRNGYGLYSVYILYDGLGKLLLKSKLESLKAAEECLSMYIHKANMNTEVTVKEIY